MWKCFAKNHVWNGFWNSLLIKCRLQNIFLKSVFQNIVHEISFHKVFFERLLMKRFFVKWHFEIYLRNVGYEMSSKNSLLWKFLWKISVMRCLFMKCLFYEISIVNSNNWNESRTCGPNTYIQSYFKLFFYFGFELFVSFFLSFFFSFFYFGFELFDILLF